ncbi:MAG: aldo/keto reductase [Spirochaetia bacterium]|jgi:aryl-alcohol dehydrogenase-like predicted oxidoreductase
MKTLPLGRTGVKVSALCLGAMNYGTKANERDSLRMLDRYVEAGGSFIDTANNYAVWWGGDGGDSERVLGAWLKERKNRGSLFLATKVGFNRPDVGPGLSAGTIKRELEGSLKRMGTDHVDLYYAHQDWRQDALEESLEAFDALRREGKLLFIGCSNYRAWRIEKARMLSREHGWAEYCCVQQRYTYLRPAPGATFEPQLAVDAELMDYCAVHSADFLLLGYSSTLGGGYAGRSDRPIPRQYAGPDTDARLAALRSVADEVGATPIQVVYAWMLQSIPAVLPLVSAGTMEQLDEDLGCLKVNLSMDQMKRLSAAGTLH